MRVLACIVLCILAVPSSAVTLTPGRYSLQWTVPKPEQAHESVMRVGMLKPMTGEQTSGFKGLASGEPLWTTIDTWTLVVDESGGTASGYDRAYLIPSHGPDGAVDLSLALRLDLRADDASLASNPDKAPSVEIKLGQGESSLKKNAAVGVVLSLARDTERGIRPVSAMLILAGHWTGTLMSDDGEVEAALIDKTANGVYDDRVGFDAQSGSRTPGDVLQFRSKGGEWTRSPLGIVTRFEGKLYSVKVSRPGDTLEITPYAGPTGVLRFETLDGKGRLVQTGESVGFVSPEIGSIDIKSGDEVTVPPGEYACSPSITFGARKKQGDPGFIATIKTARIARVLPGTNSTFAIGGPVSLTIEPDTDVPVWPIQKNVQMKLFIYAGEDELASLGLPEPPLMLMIRDAAGRLVARAQTRMNLGNPRMVPLKMPPSLTPGPHWVTVSFQPGEYQPGDTIEANKPIEVTKPGS